MLLPSVTVFHAHIYCVTISLGPYLFVPVPDRARWRESALAGQSPHRSARPAAPPPPARHFLPTFMARTPSIRRLWTRTMSCLPATDVVILHGRRLFWVLYGCCVSFFSRPSLLEASVSCRFPVFGSILLWFRYSFFVLSSRPYFSLI